MRVREFRALVSRWLQILLISAGVLSASWQAQAAARLSPEQVPAPLQPWTAWVLAEKPDALCSVQYQPNAQSLCAWPGRLQLDLRKDRLLFSQTWSMQSPDWVVLPGQPGLWPQQARMNGRDALVIERNGRPHVWLDVGRHTLDGQLSWVQRPEQIPLPAMLGLVTLRNAQGHLQPVTDIDEQGRWWPGRSDLDVVRHDEDALKVEVFRKLTDGVPLRLETRVRLEVTGKSRELQMGPAVPPLFSLQSFNSPLPARLEADGSVKVQVRPGTWELRWLSRAVHSEPQLALATARGGWPEQEWWVIESEPRLRQLSIQDQPRLDPQQTPLPPEWHAFPAWRIATGSTPVLAVDDRLSAAEQRVALNLQRHLWLDFAGGGATVQDQLSGQTGDIWRLDVHKDLALGSVTVNGMPQLVTRREDSDMAGVEVREGQLDVMAISRLREGPSFGHWALPVSGWLAGLDAVNWQLHLPPGWRLLAAGAGAESVAGSWLEQWTIWDVFLVMLAIVAVVRVLGRIWVWVALPGLILLHPEYPAMIWLLLLALLAVALSGLSLQGRVARAINLFRLLAMLALAVSTLGLSVEQVRFAVYPQLALDQVLPGGEPSWGGAGEAAMMSDVMDMASRPAAKAMRSLERYAAAPAPRPEPKALPDWDADARIQTGPGLPGWNWQQAQLGWQGPVAADDSVDLYLASPLFVALARLLMVVLFAALVMQCVLRGRPVLSVPLAATDDSKLSVAGSAPLLVLLLAACLYVPQGVEAAEFPDAELLQQLQNRLLAPPACAPDCASVQQTELVLNASTLTLTQRINVLAPTAWALPAHREAWMPTGVVLDGQTEASVRLGDQGFLMIALPVGQHEVVLEGRVAGSDKLEVRWPVTPHGFRHTVEDWTVQGLVDGRPQGGSLSFERLLQAPAEREERDTLFPDAAPLFVQIERSLVMGQRWTLNTRVVRIAPASGAIALSVPLWPGERMLGGPFPVSEGSINVVLESDAASVSWESSLNPVDRLEVAASAAQDRAEIWQVQPGPQWHMVPRLLAPVSLRDDQGQRQAEWWPRSGERLLLETSRPQAVSGATLTVEDLSLHYSPGAGRTRVDLQMAVRTSLGERFQWLLPEGWQLTELALNDQPQGRLVEPQRLDIPLAPGRHRITASAELPGSVGLFWRPDALVTPWPVVNLVQTVNFPADRWLLQTGGWGIGPAVLYWGVLPVLLVLSLGLGLYAGNPLGVGTWLLLLVGISLAQPWNGVLMIVWFHALYWRGQKPPGLTGWRFNLQQLGLGFLTLFSLLVLLSNVPVGLLGAPDMWIAGNGSGEGLLRWYLDRLPEGTLQAPWMVSVPLWVYRLLMLFWSLWLATAVVGWLRWAWGCLIQGGGWQSWRAR